MATIPTMHDWASGEVVTEALMDANIRDLGNFVLSVPHCKATRNTTQSIASGGAGTALSWITETEDGDGMITVTSDTFTVVTPGLYLVNAEATWAANATGSRVLQILVNGTRDREVRQAAGAAVLITQAVSAVVRCAASDTIKINLFQDSGANLNMDGASVIAKCDLTWLRS